jgi:hypothetical protein
LLVFDNQGLAGYPTAEVPRTGGSRVLEIDPIKNEVVWQYTGEDSGGPKMKESLRTPSLSAIPHFRTNPYGHPLCRITH